MNMHGLFQYGLKNVYQLEEAKPAFVLEPHFISFVCACVFRSKKNCCSIEHAQQSAQTKHVSHLSFIYLRLQDALGSFTHIYMLSHNTFSIVFIQLTTIKTTNSTCNTQSKKKKKSQCNISNVAKLFHSTYEISHLILQYLGNQYTERLT